MTQVRFDCQPGGVPAVDDHSADVRGPGSANAVPLMVQRKIIGQTAEKVVRLSDVFRIPAAVRRKGAEDIDAGDLIEDGPDAVVLEFVAGSAGTRPN